MRTATITETKNNLSALLDLTKSGETVLIVDRGRPIARLEPIVVPGVEPSGRLDRLERSGTIRRRSIAARSDLLDRLPPPPRVRRSVLEALLEERQSSDR